MLIYAALYVITRVSNNVARIELSKKEGGGVLIVSNNVAHIEHSENTGH